MAIKIQYDTNICIVYNRPRAYFCGFFTLHGRSGVQPAKWPTYCNCKIADINNKHVVMLAAYSQLTTGLSKLLRLLQNGGVGDGAIDPTTRSLREAKIPEHFCRPKMSKFLHIGFRSNFNVSRHSKYRKCVAVQKM